LGGGGDECVGGGSGGEAVEGGGGGETLEGGGDDDDLFGEGGDDSLFGDDGADELFGGGADDTLNGGAGNDTLEGGAGDDLFVVDFGEGNDRILDFEDGTDLIELAGFGLPTPSFTDFVSMNQVGADVLIDINGVDQLQVDNILVADLTDVDFIFS